jgi:hypothetical protein
VIPWSGDNRGMDQPRVVAHDVRPWDRPLVRYPLFALIAAVGGLFGSFTRSALLLVLAVGGTLFWLGITGRAGRRPAPQRLPRGSALWLAPILVFAAVELFAFSRHSTEDYPTLSLLADPFLDHYLTRAACYFGWLVAFWGLVRR